jgi:anaerobic selenocysteine-containing dehydrogenase
MVAGNHGLDELPDEITTPGHGQIRAMVINCGNPVVSGPDGTKLDHALEQLDLLVAIDFVQRESHRHAHWLLPAVHWLERNDLPALTSSLHDRPYVQYGRKAVEAPPGAREEWRIFVDLALAMRKPLFGFKGTNGFVKASRKLARLTRRPASNSHRSGSTACWWSPDAESSGATSWPTRTDGCSARASSGTSGMRCEPPTRRFTRPRRNLSSGLASCSPAHTPKRRTDIPSNWRTGGTATR